MAKGGVSTAVPQALALALLFLPANLTAGVPTEQLRATTDKVLAILNNPALKSPSVKEERRAQLQQVIYPRFDFAEMAKRSLGSYWQRRTPEEQREFIGAFAALLEKSYVDRIESYQGEKILYVRETQEQSFAEVDSKLVTNEGGQFALNYKLHRVNGDWKVYDVVIENISLVNNYRSQFSRVLANSSFAELLQRIQEKNRSNRN